MTNQSVTQTSWQYNYNKTASNATSIPQRGEEDYQSSNHHVLIAFRPAMESSVTEASPQDALVQKTISSYEHNAYKDTQISGSCPANLSGRRFGSPSDQYKLADIWVSL